MWEGIPRRTQPQKTERERRLFARGACDANSIIPYRHSALQHRSYFLPSDLASMRICLRYSLCVARSVLPAGNWFTKKMWARMSAAFSRLSVPGRSAGIDTRIRSNKSPTVRPYQLDRNSPPIRGGADSPPVNSEPWQAAHCMLYRASPRLACSGVYTPSQTEPGACAIATRVTRLRSTMRRKRAPLLRWLAIGDVFT